VLLAAAHLRLVDTAISRHSGPSTVLDTHRLLLDNAIVIR